MVRVVGSVDCGRKLVLSEEHRCFFNFHDFANLKVQRGKGVTSPPIFCLGREWSARIYPFGEYSSKEGFVSIFLKPQLGDDCDELRTKFELGIPNHEIESLDESEPVTFSQKDFLGYSNYIKRSEVLDSSNGHLIDGTLTVQANIQIYMDKSVTWVPKHSLSRDMLKMLNTAEFTDVTFRIGDEEFPLHLAVLKLRAPLLATLAEDFPQNNETIPLDVDPDIFKLLISFVYSDELPSDVDWSHHAKNLMDMADKFGSITLKLVAESELLKLGITSDNAADLLLYADAKNCALLRENAMNFICENTSAVMQTKGWTYIEQCLAFMTEIMNKTRGNQNRKLSRNSSGSNFDEMSVITLREKLWELDLDMDGSREMLVDRLESTLKK